MSYTATYFPEDNKLRLYSSARLDAETYARVKAAGFSYAPKQELFFAPMWTPQREDLLLELCGEIGDEDTSLVERAEELCRLLPQASKKMLAQHLREMERDGLVVRKDLSGRVLHVEYSLSESGGYAALYLISILENWSNEHLPFKTDE